MQLAIVATDLPFARILTTGRLFVWPGSEKTPSGDALGVGGGWEDGAGSVGLDPNGLDVEILFQVLHTRLATVAAHFVAAKRHGRVHCLVAVDPDRPRPDRLGQFVRLADVARPYAAAEPELGLVAAWTNSS